jgi:transcriptional regulator with XRE-family HTH domain
VHDTASIYNAVPDNDTLGGRLLRAREATGLSLKELADRLGVRPATVQAWENDRSQPRANRMQMMAGLLNVSLSWLLHGIGSGPSGDGHAELLESLALQLDRLKRLQHESQQLATRIERDMRRFAAGSHV